MGSKKLYVIRSYEGKVEFYTVKIYEENEKEYVTDSGFGWLIKGAGCNFPKDKLNKQLNGCYVTNKFYYKKLKKILETVYNTLNESHEEYIKEYTILKEANEIWYKQSLKDLEKLNVKK